MERDPALVGLEIRQGLVTAHGARDYGVVAGEDGLVDEAATDALRSEMKANREPGQLFNYGPSIEELRANCEVETGLPAPIQPVWPGSMLAEAAD
jgi:N-methylhydantoinase B